MTGSQLLRAFLLVLLFALASCSSDDSADDTYDPPNPAGLSTDACGSIPRLARVDNGKVTENKVTAKKTTGRVVNAAECSNENSAVVRFSIQDAKGTLGECTGSLITPTRVLTAGHCFAETEARVVSISVYAGGEVIQGTSARIHPKYARVESTIFFDAAIIFMERPAKAATFAVVASRQLAPEEKVGVAGYGIVGSNSTVIGTLTSGEMRIDSVTEYNIYASYQGAGSRTCYGDSGGPVFTVEGEPSGLVGIISGGYNTNCTGNDLSFFTNVHHPEMISFIQSNAPGVVIR